MATTGLFLTFRPCAMQSDPRFGSSRLAEAQRELVGLAANARVEDVGGARVVGALVEVAFRLELEARLGERGDHRRLVDAVQAVGQRRAAAVGAL